MSCAGGSYPFWAKDIKVGFANIKAKAEGIEGKPAFREAFQRRRCLVPVDNFYEWKKDRRGQTTPVRDFESARWPRSLGEPNRFRPTVR
jgi:putative SOS response-associated peptidase YedK